MNNFPNIRTAGIITNFKQEQPQPEAQGNQPALFSGMAASVHLSEQDVTQAISALPPAYQQGPRPRPLSVLNVSPQAALQYLPQLGLPQTEIPPCDPFAALATHQPIHFDEDSQLVVPYADEHFKRPLPKTSESSQQSRRYKRKSTTTKTTTTHKKRVTSATSTVPLTEQASDSTDKWIIVEKSEKRRFKCGYLGCDKSYKKKSHLVAHFIEHTGVSKFGCTYPECIGKRYFRDKTMLDRHIRIKHTLEKPFKCDNCERQFRRKDELRQHRKRIHFIEDEKKYQEQPDDSLSSSNEPSQPVGDSGPIVIEEPHWTTLAVLLANDDSDPQTRTITSIPKLEILPSINDHFRRALTGIVPEVPEALLTELAGDPQHLTSDYIASQPDPTDRWILQTGDPMMPLRCGYEGCYKRFSKKWILQRHFSVHIGDSRFRCYLGKCTGTIKFRNKQALSRHITTNHTHDKLFHCCLCTKRFGRKDTLLKHRRKYHPDAPPDV